MRTASTRPPSHATMSLLPAATRSPEPAVQPFLASRCLPDSRFLQALRLRNVWRRSIGAGTEMERGATNRGERGGWIGGA
ncbi:hypothetical protein CLOM_g14426 [Closterium sp. NIES-68]|nr:hypothetical protein CLOM_g14426 [Closterium sp. NIES-68]GJP78397.1 hypothetical protein CLOP_g8699 [Closterium sp. NIES-67]